MKKVQSETPRDTQISNFQMLLHVKDANSVSACVRSKSF